MSGHEPLLVAKKLSCTTWHGYEERLSFVNGVLALIVGMVGTGSVAFPYGFSLCGFAAAPFVLGTVAFLSFGSYVSLINVTKTQKVGTYSELVLRLPTFWDKFGKFALWTILILCTSAYVLISADIVKSVLTSEEGDADEPPFYLKDPILFAMIVIVVLPLCLMKSMRGLSLISAYCTFALFCVVGIIVVESVNICINRKSGGTDQFAMAPVRRPKTMVLSMPIFGTAMFGHMNMAQIYAELKPDLKPQATKVAAVATAMCFGIYTVIGYAGYIAFGKNAESDVMKQIAAEVGETKLVLMGQALLASFIILKAPLLVLPVRQVTFDVIFPDGDAASLPLGKHVLLTFGVLACVYIFAVAIPDLGKLLEILGAVSAIPIIFIVPARLSWSFEETRPVLRCIVLAVFGTVVSAISILLVFKLI